MIYARLEDQDTVGFVLRTDSRDPEGKYVIRCKHTGKVYKVPGFTTLTAAEYEAHQPQSVATTKPKRGAKK